ncbi:MAG: low specificity L-threonine aldolase [Spirochaetaceae bacterium]|nr:low specificity L-threonine aldolase [Spirochaetaceae bacterium]
MIHFECDYTEGACPEILESITANNFVQYTGYGEDQICNQARQKIKNACNAPNSEVYFLVGGTQANLTVISAALRPHQGIIAPATGHINVHEAGAIESSGHKVLALPSNDGKITAQQIEETWQEHWNDSTHAHMVQPAMVYISFSTEGGLLYTKAELEAISAVCRKCNLLLFVDGARLGYGLASPANNCNLSDFARLCDVFYIGGTKVGALFGEAVVITNKMLQKDFGYIIKQKGGLLAKGWLLGIQFDTLFTDDLYLKIAKNAVEKALRIKKAFEQKGIPFLFESHTNQQFPILTAQQQTKLNKKYATSLWQQLDNGKAAVRFCTSWATTEENLNQLLEDINQL